jgi:hypothetical protein
MRFAYYAAGLSLFAASCFGEIGCDFDLDDCELDSDCAAGEVCDPTFAGNSCLPAEECSTDADCADGLNCVQRPPRPPENPFDDPTPNKSVCECVGDDCGTTTITVSSSSSSSSSSSGGGEGGGGGAGGQGEGGGGGQGQGGDSGQGGAAGGGGA